MKCPECEQEMRRVEVEYTSCPEMFVLDEETGRYHIEDIDEPEDDDLGTLFCGECGHELTEEQLETFYGLVLD